MLKISAFAFTLLLSMTGCDIDSDTTQPPGPIDSSEPTPPTPGQECQTACKNLLAECEPGTTSSALDDCRRDCRAEAFSAEEVACLAKLDCTEPSDSCLEG